MNINVLITDKLLQFFDFNEDGYVVFIAIALAYVLLMFVAISIYTFLDCRKRGVHLILSILIALTVLIFNIPAFILYLILRPSKTKSETEWEDLERKFLSHEVDDFISCDNCKSVLSDEDLFCPNCGKQHRIKCSCSKLLEASWAYCPNCGKQSTFEKKVRVINNVTDNEESISNRNERIRITNKNKLGFGVKIAVIIGSIKTVFTKLINKIKAGISDLSNTPNSEPQVEVQKSSVRVLEPSQDKTKKKKNKSKKRRRR